MLFALHIQNIALLDDVEIEFQKGLNVLTGETGAGKSILIGSINLLLGDRANRELIRHDADRAEVSGIFYIENEFQERALESLGIFPEEDGSVTLSRQLLRDGKNLCRIAGRSATLSELRQVGDLLVNIHGQHDSQALLNPAEHIHFLDSFLKEEGKALLASYQAAYKNWRSLLRESEAFDLDEAEKLRKIDMLSFEINEIRSASLSPGEEEDLKTKRDMINHRKKLESGVMQALCALCDAEDGMDARQGLAIASDALSDASGYDSTLSELSERVDALAEEADEISRRLRQYFDRLSDDDFPVDEIESRLDIIYRLKRKYGASVQAVLEYADACEAELSELQNAEERKEKLLADLEKAEENAKMIAKKLSALREKAIPAICIQINEALHFLNMPDADFRIDSVEAPLSPYGAEQVIFTIQTNSGEDYRPLNKIVSGGELSRIMLAIKSVLTNGDAAQTLIFDEIDTGVSGATAQKIGRKLRALADSKQVLCVTHLAQIAAMATTHFLIDKSSENGRTRTNVTPLDHENRVKELARIISGDAVTETTLKQAEELIEFGDTND